MEKKQRNQVTDHAMAMSRSLALIFLLSTILAVRSAATGGGGGGGVLEKLCNTTMYPSNCLESLSPTPRQLAVTAFAFLAKEGPALYAETRDAHLDAINKKNQTLTFCFDVLNGVLKDYVVNLSGLEPDRSDAEFAEAKARLDMLLEAPSSSGVSCGDPDLWKETLLIRKVFNYELMMQDTLDLMTTAAQAQPAPGGPGRAKAPAPGPGRAEAPTA